MRLSQLHEGWLDKLEQWTPSNDPDIPVIDDFTTWVSKTLGLQRVPDDEEEQEEESEEELNDVDIRKKDAAEKIIKPITSMAVGGTVPPGQGKHRGPPGAGAFGLAPTR